MKYSGIIFDFNGVLIWDGALQEQAWKAFSAQLRGTPFTDEEMRIHMHGRPNAWALEYLTGRKLAPDELAALTQAKETIYRQMCLDLGAEFKLSPGAIGLLDFLVAHNVPHTIATASEQTNLQFFIRTLQLDKWFDVAKIVFDDGYLPGKPEPDIYLKAAANLGLPPAACIVVEDSLAGLRAAQRAGIGRIYALGPATQHQKLRAVEGVNDVISHLGEIPTEIFRRA